MWLRASCWWFIVFCDLVGCFLGGVSGRALVVLFDVLGFVVLGGFCVGFD